MNHYRKPIYEALKKHWDKHPVSLHVPGHKYGIVNPVEQDFFFDQIMKLDATELSGLDDLHHPEGVIKEAEDLLADLYGVQNSYLLVNGTTVGNLAMILATIQEGDVVFVQRNCHKSILNGISLVKAVPVFLEPEYYPEWRVSGGISLYTLEQAFQMYRNVTALILTYPNYYGMVYELEKLIKLAHQHRVPVLIDEAHGAHFIAGAPFPKSAVQLGADVVVQSAHKTLPALTMGSFFHFNSSLISRISIEKYLYLLQSSSPSYVLMASLDNARSYLATYRDEDKQYMIGEIQQFIEELEEIKEIKVLVFPNQLGDRLKLTVQSLTSLTGFELQQLLEGEGVYTELADPHNILMVLPLLKNGVDFPFTYIIESIKKVVNNYSLKEKPIYLPLRENKIRKLELNHEQIERIKKKDVLIIDAVGQICAESVIPYPPGIPLLLPGELITIEDVETIKELIQLGARFQGRNEITSGRLSIYAIGD
ncbi:aminotransferase class I/II-fold pyridoxal phosphate-dependent enzyme [Cytobacillus sp. Hz8]|uniref:aminotransferase class I/II-fold pyridoxal phosphate-dependent enzyme n=1 Tax=Cytobacillus sp. Hz8 TaxID=3347168 RepID=UPI0035D9DDC2